MEKGQQNRLIVLNPAPQRVIKLTKAAHVRLEMARVYCECRNGQMDVSDGSKFVFMLTAIGKQISDNDLEQRIEQLEESAQKGNNHGKF